MKIFPPPPSIPSTTPPSFQRVIIQSVCVNLHNRHIVLQWSPYSTCMEKKLLQHIFISQPTAGYYPPHERTTKCKHTTDGHELPTDGPYLSQPHPTVCKHSLSMFFLKKTCLNAHFSPCKCAFQSL